MGCSDHRHKREACSLTVHVSSFFDPDADGFSSTSQTYYDFEGKFGFHDANFIIHPEHFFVSYSPPSPPNIRLRVSVNVSQRWLPS